MKRYVSIDFLRGLAIFGVVFFHLFSDLFDEGSVYPQINTLPASLIVTLLVIIYMGSWGGFFVTISGTGNMVSMQKHLQDGKRVKDVVMKQVVGGIILLVFSMLTEGVFQYYAFLGTLVNGPVDWTRIVWHAYAMTPVTCLAVCMVINGLLYGAMARNGGYAQIKRNILIFAVLAVVIIACTQPAWDWAKTLIVGYPNAHQTYASNLPGDYKVSMPPMTSTFFQLAGYLLLDFVAGTNTPLFPFLACSFVGSIIGLILMQEKPSPSIPKKGMVAGALIFAMGIILGLILHLGFGSFLPISNFADITSIGNGLNGNWIPWFFFQFGGPLVATFLLLRLVEFRGKAAAFGQKTRFIRRFGVPAFTIYAFHRFMAMVPILLLAAILGITLGKLSMALTLLFIAVSILFIHLILLLWERVDYIGSIEWMIGTVAGVVIPGMPSEKHMGAPSRSKWYLAGRINVQKLFYEAEWIDIVPATEIPHEDLKESKLAFKLAIIGIFLFPVAVIALVIARNSIATERQNKYNRRGTIVAILALALTILLIIGLSLVSLSTFGVSL